MEQSKQINIKRTFTYTFAALAIVALFFGIVHMVLVVAHVSKPAIATVYGLTPRRRWALVVIVMALVSVIIGWRTFRQSAASRISILKGKRRAIAAIVLGLLAVISGGLNLAAANGGPGTGNGVVGSAQALVLGLIGIVLGGLTLTRYRRNAL